MWLAEEVVIDLPFDRSTKTTKNVWACNGRASEWCREREGSDDDTGEVWRPHRGVKRQVMKRQIKAYWRSARGSWIQRRCDVCIEKSDRYLLSMTSRLVVEQVCRLSKKPVAERNNSPIRHLILCMMRMNLEALTTARTREFWIC